MGRYSEPEAHSGKYNEELDKFTLILMGETLEIYDASPKSGPDLIAKVPVKIFHLALNKKLNKELTLEELFIELGNYTPLISVEAEFTMFEGSPYRYGDDADGNRGEIRTDIEDLEEDNLEIHKSELRLIDDDGEALGGEDNFIELGDVSSKEDALAKWIVSEINSNTDNYL